MGVHGAVQLVGFSRVGGHVFSVSEPLKRTLGTYCCLDAVRDSGDTLEVMLVLRMLSDFQTDYRLHI